MSEKYENLIIFLKELETEKLKKTETKGFNNQDKPAKRVKAKLSKSDRKRHKRSQTKHTTGKPIQSY